LELDRALGRQIAARYAANTATRADALRAFGLAVAAYYYWERFGPKGGNGEPGSVIPDTGYPQFDNMMDAAWGAGMLIHKVEEAIVDECSN